MTRKFRMIAAVAYNANARPIRVLCSPLSTNKTSYGKVGQLGEEVLRNSEN